MAKDSKIEWTEHTFNPWWGCVKISPACTNCYAATFDHRLGGDHWGPRSDRKFFGDKHWNEPIRWDRAAKKAGVRHRVFCASMADVFEDRRDLDAQRERLWDLIERTPNLDWLLLTKRPENIAGMFPGAFGSRVGYPLPWKNVWLGTTVESQDHAEERIPHLLAVPAVVHFLSCEPLLGPLDLHHLRAGFRDDVRLPEAHYSALQRHRDDNYYESDNVVSWVIAGCESGPGARPSSVEWYRSLRDQCASAGVAFLLKQAMQRGSEAVGGPLIAIGEGSWTKAGGVIELPYLDGVQHAEFPR